MTPFLPLSPPTRHRLSAFLVGLLVGMGVVGMLGCERSMAAKTPDELVCELACAQRRPPYDLGRILRGECVCVRSE
jgi:hypothetical protein